MPGVSDIWPKFALLKFKLSTSSAVFRCQGGKGDDTSASSQLFRGSYNICLVLWYPDHESKSFQCLSIFSTPLRSFQPSSTFLSDAFRSRRSSLESCCSCVHHLSWAFCLHLCWIAIHFTLLSNLWSFEFSSLFMLLVTCVVFRLLTQENYCEMLLLTVS